ncbi:MAG: sulfite exporter TauE/SafE family protein [Burkholderiales bacterium]
MLPPPETLLFAALVVAGAFVVFGITGFGSTILAVPLLAHVLPLKFVIPMFVLLDFGAALRTGFKFHATIAKRELAWLVPCMLVGIVAGVFLLVSLPGDLIMTALGVFVLAYGLYAASGREPSFKLSRWWALPVGSVGGVISALFGAAGPLYVIYLGARGLDVAQVRATMSIVFLITTGTRITLFALAGLFAQDGVLTMAAILALPMFAGLWIGHHMHVTLSRKRLMQVIGSLLILSGGSLVVRAIF